MFDKVKIIKGKWSGFTGYVDAPPNSKGIISICFEHEGAAYVVEKNIKDVMFYNIGQYETLFHQIEDLPDFKKRKSLILSWQGQINYCNRKMLKDPKHFESLATAWQEKINRCLAGEPLNQIQGKVKAVKRTPKKQRKKEKRKD